MTGEAPRPQPKPAKRPPKPRKALVSKCECGHHREFHDCTKVGRCARCIFPSCPKFRPKALVRTRMKRRPPRRLKGAGSDKPFLAWLHTQPCCFAPWCKEGPIEAAHHRDMTGLGRKEPDRNAIPLCRSHHQQFDGHFGAFLLAEKPARKRWFLAKIEATQAAWGRA